MSVKELQRPGGEPPIPPVDGGNGGGDGDDPERKREMMRFIRLTREQQARSYRDRLRDWYNNESRLTLLRELAQEYEDMEDIKRVNHSVESILRSFAETDKRLLEEADSWVVNPAQFNLWHAFLGLYGQHDDAWDIAEAHGLDEGQLDEAGASDGARLDD